MTDDYEPRKGDQVQYYQMPGGWRTGTYTGRRDYKRRLIIEHGGHYAEPALARVDPDKVRPA